MTTIHASLDNQTDRVRLSSDTRYQRASQPADTRWIGANPPTHGPKLSSRPASCTCRNTSTFEAETSPA